MKSFAKIALLVFYVLFNAGLSYSMHFCGKDFQRFNLLLDYQSCCESKVPMPDCCEDVLNFELTNTDQKLSDLFNFQPLRFELLNARIFFEFPVHFIAEDKITVFADSSPPIFQNAPIYIFCQVFLI
ncbi:HYC_CC_PP family protein [Cecembia rubra]|uniref:Uncharacterized protein n=1 Tax=Cecembia rubra TaxID=1485585 RepID=A0A2P8DW82_9BACT|nr:hypothetical protein [Cecembia rubra]PSL01476.1 hypothetical protein CLV48_11370 [Cecembia rubra]